MRHLIAVSSVVLVTWSWHASAQQPPPPTTYAPPTYAPEPVAAPPTQTQTASVNASGSVGSGSPSSSASTESNEDSDVGDRTLKGHTFVYPMLPELEKTAFVTTHFGVRQGFQFVQVPKVPLGKFGMTDLNVTGLTQSFDLGVKIVDMVGLYATGSGQVILGVNGQSVLLFGGQFQASGEGGAVVRLWRNAATGTQISARLGAGGGGGQNVNIGPLVVAIQNQPNETFDAIARGDVTKYLLTPTSFYLINASAHVAQALNAFLSVQAMLGIRHRADSASPYESSGEQKTTTISTQFANAAIGLTVDGSRVHIPLAASLEYQVNGPIAVSEGKTGDAEHFIAGGLYYSGRRDLQLGIGVGTQLGLKPLEGGVDENNNPTPSGAPWIVYGQFVLRYIWGK